jgi:NitT/TauT family transport system permease protein
VSTTLELLLLAGSGTAALALLARGEGRAAHVATPLLFGALVLAAWQIACAGFDIPRVLLPAPSAVAAAIVRSFPILAADFMQTVAHAVLIGWVIGCASGLLAAVALDRSEFLRRGIMPLGSLVSAMPIVGVAPIMVMWFGFDWPSKAAVIVVMTFFPMLVNATAGLEATGAMERDLMHSYGAGYWQTLLKLRLPNALPFVFNALKLNSTLALIGGIVAEFFGTPIVGMGFRISTEVARMNLDVVWAEITLAALVGSASFAALALIERAATFWHPSFRR